MASIREIVTQFMKTGMETRLAGLEKMQAPAVMIEAVRGALENPCKGIRKLEQYGDLEVLQHEAKKFRKNNGIVFTTGQGIVTLIPGPYGWFLAPDIK
jgi:hypothetical protein